MTQSPKPGQTILALDLGTTTGWALRAPERAHCRLLAEPCNRCLEVYAGLVQIADDDVHTQASGNLSGIELGASRAANSSAKKWPRNAKRPQRWAPGATVTVQLRNCLPHQ